MAEAGPALREFSSALEALWKAAGTPPYSAIIRRLGKGSITDSALSAWIRGTNAPSPEKTEVALELVRYLDAIKKDSRHQTRPEAWWQLRLKNVQEERASNRGGRPRSAARTPQQISARAAVAAAAGTERHRLLGEHQAWIEDCFLPDLLLDREDELRELEAFCASPESGDQRPYAWWQAAPWAGKTALLAEFVVRRRPQHVEVVSHFIARRLGNNDRDTFIAEVSPQLAVIAGRKPARSGLRPKDLHGLYSAAADACRHQGKRLLLVVDGLDEDAVERNHSIAGLLPRNPPPGMLILVAGRPNPPVPDDVPADHPLREPSIVRQLAPYTDADVISAMAAHDLQELLQDQKGSALLGLLTAARGGLTGKDLAHLTGVTPHDIDMKLHRITGRSFVPEKNSHLPRSDRDANDRTYVLGHDVLYETAVDKLGVTARTLAEQQLHEWADTYRNSGWPADTPAYLLYRYPTLIEGDAERLATFVLDPRRQLALVGRSTADAALAQLELTRRMATTDGPSNLATLAALAASWDMLSETAEALPPGLAEAFARLGHLERAMDIARAARNSATQARRLAALARTLAQTNHDAAVKAALEAAELARQSQSEADHGDEYDTETAIGEAAVALLCVGHDTEGLALLAMLRVTVWLGIDTLPGVTLVEASLVVRERNGELAEELLEQAERRAELIVSPADPASRITVWAAIARAAGPARASRIYKQISEYANSFPPGLGSSRVYAVAASALAPARSEQAAELAQRAARHLEAVLADPASLPGRDLMELDFALTSTVCALVDIGADYQAHQLAEAVPGALRGGPWAGDIRSNALAALDGPASVPGEKQARKAAQLAEEGRMEEAEQVLREALDATSAARPGGREDALVVLARALAAVGLLADAEQLAASLRDLRQQVRALASISVEVAAAGQLGEASRLAHEAASRCDRLEGAGNFRLFDGVPGELVAAAQGEAAQALARAGDRDAALALAEQIVQASRSAGSRALIAAAAALSDSDPAIAVQLVDREREALTESIRGDKVCELVELLTAIADADSPCRERIERAIEDACSRHGLASLAHEDLLALVVLEARNQPQEALGLLVKVEQAAASAPTGYVEPGALAIARAVFKDYDGARAAALDHHVPFSRAVAFAAVAAYLTRTPPGLRSTSYTSSSAIVHVLHTLALLVAPPEDGPARTVAETFTAAALDGAGWYHALPVLARIAPKAVERVRDIVFTHRHLTPANQHAPTPGERLAS